MKFLKSKRYFDLVLYVILSYCFIVSVTPVFFESDAFKKWSYFLLSLPQIIEWLFYAVIGVTVTRVLTITGDYNKKQERPLINRLRLCYPPLRFSIAILICIFFYQGMATLSNYPYYNLSSQYRGDFFKIWSATAVFFIGLAFSSVSALFNSLSSNKEPVKKEMSTPEETGKLTLLKKWIDSEEPISSTEEDLLGISHIVDRIVTRITKKVHDFRGQAIVGDFGSGKSSIVKLIDKQISAHDDWITCHFDSWGRINDGNQAQKLLLEKIIEEIGYHTTVTPIKSIPKDYLNTLNGLGSWWRNSMSFLYQTDLKPEDQLQKIDNLLKSANINLLVFIEDLDRNTNSLDMSEGLNPLIDRLVKTDNIQFIFTIGYDNHISSVISRVTNYRQDLVMNEKAIDQIMLLFRTLCTTRTADMDYFDGSTFIDNWPLRDGRYRNSEQHETMLRYKEAYHSLCFYLKKH